MAKLNTISPITGETVIETKEATKESVQTLIADATKAQSKWAETPLEERMALVSKLLDLLVANKQDLGLKLTQQMGRPIQFTPGEVATAAERGRVLLGYANDALKLTNVDEASRPQQKKYLTKEPRGVCLIIFPWNYPYLCLVNGLVPCLVAGNAAVIKPSPQTPQVADAVAQLAHEAGIPSGLVSVLHSGDNDLVAGVVADKNIAAVSFTGSVEGGLAVQRAAASRTIPIALELGGNDAAYVCANVDVGKAAESIADGALFNSGQSCCSIERVYVHKSIYAEFVDAIVGVVQKYKVGDPREPGFDMGPMVSAQAAKRVRSDIQEAVAAGAKQLVKWGEPMGDAYVYPQVVVDLARDSKLLTTETFGPVIPIVRVESDEEAIELINDSQFGLSASVWTRDTSAGDRIASKLDAGTVFVNKCDYPDPHLAWTGFKYSGRGVSLSKFGFDFWLRIKSHFVQEV